MDSVSCTSTASTAGRRDYFTKEWDPIFSTDRVLSNFKPWSTRDDAMAEDAEDASDSSFTTLLWDIEDDCTVEDLEAFVHTSDFDPPLDTESFEKIGRNNKAFQHCRGQHDYREQHRATKGNKGLNILMEDEWEESMARKEIVPITRSDHFREHAGHIQECVRGAITFGVYSRSNRLRWSPRAHLLPRISIISKNTGHHHIRIREKRGWHGFARSLWLPISQVACGTVLGNYKPPTYTNTHTGWIEKIRDGSCSQIQWHSTTFPTKICNAIMSTWVDPSPTLFVAATIAFGISCMLYYMHNQNHKYQRHALASGFLIGGFLSLYLWMQNTIENPVTTIIPASITISLVLSAILHSIWQCLVPRKVEKVIRCVKIPASDGALLREFLRAKKGDEKSSEKTRFPWSLEAPSTEHS